MRYNVLGLAKPEVPLNNCCGHVGGKSGQHTLLNVAVSMLALHAFYALIFITLWVFFAINDGSKIDQPFFKSISKKTIKTIVSGNDDL